MDAGDSRQSGAAQYHDRKLGWLWGAMEKIYETYGKIYQEIIPNTPYTPIKNIILHFEKYDYRFHWNRDNSVIEIWIPIQD